VLGVTELTLLPCPLQRKAAAEESAIAVSSAEESSIAVSSAQHGVGGLVSSVAAHWLQLSRVQNLLEAWPKWSH